MNTLLDARVLAGVSLNRQRGECSVLHVGWGKCNLLSSSTDKKIRMYVGVHRRAHSLCLRAD